MSAFSAGGEPSRNQGRRAADRRVGERRLRLRRVADRLRIAGWDEQRTQFMTRYLFGVLGLAYFNIGDPVTRDATGLLMANVVCLAYLVLNTLYLLHARLHLASATRLRLTMWTDILGVSAAAYLDVNVMSPAYLVYVVITLGNGMRYGMRAFAEAVVGSFAAAAVVFSLRIGDDLQHISVTGAFFILFIGIIVLYSYALMRNVDRARGTLELASLNDALTGLLNRRGLQERTQALFLGLGAARPPVAVLFADLDGFKGVNDAHGHAAGDRLLQQVARAIMSQLRANDIVARFGGDEFVVVLPESSIEQAGHVAKRLQQAVAALDDGTIRLSATIGIGLAPEHGADLDTVLKAVDGAMYEGKAAGGRGVIRRVDGVVVA